MLSQYYDRAKVAGLVRRGEHRTLVGGSWDELGQLQFDYLVANGLKPTSLLLDIGCGSLRAGVRLVPYLDAGNYFGTDINGSLLEAGYCEEITRLGLVDKLPRSNLVVDGSYNFSWSDKPFDFALAQSLFTHLPLEQLRLCLENLAPVVVANGVFFVTYFEVPEDVAFSEPYSHSPGGVTTFADRDPYHYRKEDVLDCCRGLPWSATYVGDWNHPRAQKMVHFTKRA